eukprot:2265967-Prymnesium_polylepis.1
MSFNTIIAFAQRTTPTFFLSDATVSPSTSASAASSSSFNGCGFGVVWWQASYLLIIMTHCSRVVFMQIALQTAAGGAPPRPCPCPCPCHPCPSLLASRAGTAWWTTRCSPSCRAWRCGSRGAARSLGPALTLAPAAPRAPCPTST